MNNGQKSLSINETFIVEGLEGDVLSACTGFYTNALISCTGNTQILLSNNIIKANSAFSATTFYGDGSNLTGISTQDTFVTGGTYNSNSGIAAFTNNTGGTFSVSGFYTGSTDIYITGVTFSNNLLSLYRNDGAILAANINSFTSLTVNGSVSATTFYGDGSNLTGISTQDTFVTGGTYSAGTAVFTNNTGGTFNVTGFSASVATQFTGGTVTGATFFNNGLSANTFSASTYLGLPIDVFVTGATKSNDVATFVNNTGGTFTLTGLTDTIFTGGTVVGPTYFTNGLTANTFSATTYLNLPLDIRVTGGTYSAGTAVFKNNTGGTFSVTGFSVSNATQFTGGTVSGATTFTNGLTADTISATTYFNLPPTPFLPLSGGTVTGQVILKNNSTPLIITTDNYSPGTSGNILFYGDITGSTNAKSINSRSNGGSSAGVLILQQDSNGFVGVNTSSAIPIVNYNLHVNGTFGATSVSATTYFNLPPTPYLPLSGGTVSGTTSFTGGLTANTISATTYQNLPISIVFNDNLISTGLMGSGAGVSGLINDSIFLGYYAGYVATNAYNSNFFGQNAGFGATNAFNSNFIGASAGDTATSANNSNFIGTNAGIQASGASNSNFIGTQAGDGATNANNSNFFGFQVGSGATGNNNIIIGTNISLTGSNSINLGGVLFGTGAYAITAGTPTFSANTGGRIGINIVTPTETLHVSGNTRIEGGLSATTISATTYLNLPNTTFTGGTVSGATTFTSGVTANTISSTTVTAVNVVNNDFDYMMLTSFRTLYNY